MQKLNFSDAIDIGIESSLRYCRAYDFHSKSVHAGTLKTSGVDGEHADHVSYCVHKFE